MSELIHSVTEPKYTLSVAAKLSATPQHSIRQYIDKGLIIPYKKKSNRHLFSDIDIQRLVWIKQNLDNKGLTFAGIKTLLALIPCWKIINCDVKSRKKCEAYNFTDYPCWEASEKGKECINKDCRVCEVYQIINPDFNLKTILKEMLH